MSFNKYGLRDEIEQFIESTGAKYFEIERNAYEIIVRLPQKRRIDDGKNERLLNE